MSSEVKHFYEFGDFRFDDGKRILWRDGDVVALTPKAADLLSALVERRGDVLERGELLDLIWKDTFVEEGNLSYTVSNLRKILGKNGSNGYIQTVPRRGYRFTAKLRDSWDEGDSDIVIERNTLSETVVDEFHIDDDLTLHEIPSSKARYKTKPVAVALLAAGLILIAAVAWQLTRESSANSPNFRSIAVLPFKTIDSANQEPHRGLGMADILITRLNGVRGLSVRPTTAVTAFENNDADAREIGNSLGVDAVIEGTIYNVADGVRVTARMLRVSDGTALWQGVFNKPLKDALSIENEISMELANALSLNLRADAGKVSNPDAYELYVKGRYEWNKRDYQGLAKAQQYFRSAIEKDPGFALAYVALADSVVFLEETPELNYSLTKAIELDPNLGEAYATLGFLHTVHKWQWREAEANFKRSIELNPGYSTAHHWYAILLGIEGRFEEAKAEMQKALDIDPTSFNYLADMGQIYYFERDYVNAKKYCKKALELNPDFVFAHEHLENINWKLGDHEAAIDEHVQRLNTNIRTASPTGYTESSLQKNFELFKAPYRSGGLKRWVAFYLDHADSLSSVRRNPNTAYGAARFNLLIGEKQKALDNLEIALERKAFLMAWIKADPMFDPIRDEPRYQNILKKMGLV